MVSHMSARVLLIGFKIRRENQRRVNTLIYWVLSGLLRLGLSTRNRVLNEPTVGSVGILRPSGNPPSPPLFLEGDGCHPERSAGSTDAAYQRMMSTNPSSLATIAPSLPRSMTMRRGTPPVLKTCSILRSGGSMTQTLPV